MLLVGSLLLAALVLLVLTARITQTVGGYLETAAGVPVVGAVTPAAIPFNGGGQASATALAGGLNRVGTSVATSAPFDSVALPPAVAGETVVLINDSANPIQVFGAGTDTIRGIATATGVTQGPNSLVVYYCAVAGNWLFAVGGAEINSFSTLAASGAVAPHTANTYVITKAGVAALTLAAPTATVDDGVVITLTSNTANAHTLTATGLLQTGTANVNTATFAAQPGAGLTLMAYQGKWNVLASVGITFS